MSSDPLISAGVSIYPSHSHMMRVTKEKETHILEAIHEGSRQLFMPSAEDHGNTKADGLADAFLEDRLEIVEFEDMKHGWVTRGNVSDEQVKRDVARAIDLTVEHFETYLK